MNDSPVSVSIFTKDRSLARDLKCDQPFNVTISAIRSDGAKDLGAPSLNEIVILVFGIATDASFQLFLAWLYDQIKGRAEYVNAGGEKAGIEKVEIERVLKISYKYTKRHTVSGNKK